MSAKLVVLGGNGFIGREVCRQAIEHGHRVVGLGRSGRPAVSASWAGRVDWVAADVLRPEDWRGHLDGATAVVHSIAILREYAYPRLDDLLPILTDPANETPKPDAASAARHESRLIANSFR